MLKSTSACTSSAKIAREAGHGISAYWQDISPFVLLILLGLISTIVVIPGLFNSAVSSKALWLETASALTLPFYFKRLLAHPELRPNFRNPLTVAVITFLLVSLVAGIVGFNINQSIWGTYERMGGVYQLTMLTLLYLYVLSLGQTPGWDVKALLRVLVGSATLASLYGTWVTVREGLTNPSMFLEDRVSSVYGNPIFFASFLVLPLAVTIFLWLDAKNTTSRRVYSILLGVQVVGVLLSATRGVVLALVVVVFVGGLLSAILHGSWRATIAFLVGAVVTALALSYAAHRLPLTVSVSHLFSTRDDGRLIIWRVAWHGFWARPLLGFGPENFYVVVNKYFDRGLYKQVPLGFLFDKPHNYLLEILVTTGVSGLLAYAAIMALTIRSLWKAFRSGVISRSQSITMIAGIAAYHIQNCFAFETPASSVALYLFTAFAASLDAARPSVSTRRHFPPSEFRQRLRAMASIAICLVVLIACAVNVATAMVLRDLRDGIRIGGRNPVVAQTYFDNAANSVFVYDRATVGQQYLLFVKRLLLDIPDNVDASFVNKTFNGVGAVLEQSAKQNANNAELWLNVAELDYMRTNFNNAPVDQRGYAAIREARLLAPNRFDPDYYLARYYAADNRVKEAETLLNRIAGVIPQDPVIRWQLSTIYLKMGKTDLAIQTATQAMWLGYRPMLKQLLWMINYHIDKQDYGATAQLYKQAIELRPDDFRLYMSLAATYAKLGAWQNARDAADMAYKLNPSPEMRRAKNDFLASHPY